MTNLLIDKANIQKIAEEGKKIYEKIKKDYEPNKNGKFLAIEIDSGKTYLGSTSLEALEVARSTHPDKVFYVVRIGFNFAEMFANSFINYS
ncbi:MAG: hypothetical protein AAB739_01055 [Patescibacteria group bacterium]